MGLVRPSAEAKSPAPLPPSAPPVSKAAPKSTAPPSTSPPESLDRLKALLDGSLADPSSVSFEYLANCTLQWDLERKLGEGTFGDVFLAVDVDRGVRFVVKKINLLSLAAVSDAPLALGNRMRESEIMALTKFRSPLIVKLVGFTALDARQICLAYEYCAGGALDKALSDGTKAGELTYKQRIRVALGVAKALNYLHRGGGGGRCFHRDVKSANICLTSSLAPKLIDCGLARFIPEGDERVALTATGNSQPGTVGYMCPRYQCGDVKFSEKSEVFSFGVVLLELAVGDITLAGSRGNLYFRFFPPDLDDTVELLADAFDRRAELDGAWPDALKTDLASLIKSCLKGNPTKRVGLQAAMQQLRDLEKTHCVESGSERMVAAMREERERYLAAAQIKDASERSAVKSCLICFDEQPSGNGVECSGAHFYCSTCYGFAFGDELQKIANTPVLAEDHQKREGKMRCPQRIDGCTVLFTDQQLARCLSDDLFSKYSRLKDETYAEKVREQAEIDVRAQLQREIELGNVERRRQEDIQSGEMIQQEIRAGRMKRCVRCRVPIMRSGGCDHMNCRGPGGCGAHFCFVCDATPSTSPGCPGAGRRHEFYP